MLLERYSIQPHVLKNIHCKKLNPTTAVAALLSASKPCGPGRGGGYSGISSDRDDQRIFWGVEIFDIGNFLGKKILATCFATVFVFWKFLWLGNSA